MTAERTASPQEIRPVEGAPGSMRVLLWRVRASVGARRLMISPSLPLGGPHSVPVFSSGHAAGACVRSTKHAGILRHMSGANTMVRVEEDESIRQQRFRQVERTRTSFAVASTASGHPRKIAAEHRNELLVGHGCARAVVSTQCPTFGVVVRSTNASSCLHLNSARNSHRWLRRTVSAARNRHHKRQ